MKVSHILIGFTLASLLGGSQAAHNDNSCAVATTVTKGSEYRVLVTDKSVKEIKPNFFGFNLEWVGFQEDLWDRQAMSVRPEVVGALRAFRGAAYRYPGGTVANYFDWRASVGPQLARPSRRAVDWKGPLATSFGFHEYLKFLSEVNGQVWLVTNLYGVFEGESDLGELTAQAGQWSNAVRGAGAQALRWELGNELDRDRYQWSAEKYTTRAHKVADAIRTNDPTARFVALLQDYDAQPGISAQSYNTQVALAMSVLSPDYALHLYYDGSPGGPPIPHRLRHLCTSARAVEAGSGKQVDIWITEHARWPSGRTTDKDWKQNWPKATNLEGAISVADMVIALSQAPGVKGAFLHSLSGTTNPWPLFHRTSSGLRPSAVYWALRVLRESLLDEVIETRTSSRNDSGYAGGYDMRASVMADVGRRKFAVWATNRMGQEVKFHLLLPAMANATVSARLTSLTDPNPNASNSVYGERVLPVVKSLLLTFDAQGQTLVDLPAHSVSALTFSKQ